MATGTKTLVGRVGLGPDGQKLTSILETLAEAGIATGFVSSGPITNATPAGFLTHALSREDKAEVSRQLAGSRAAILVGGSKGFVASEEAARRGFTVLAGDEAFLGTDATRVLALRERGGSV
jgi:alkaline phosphatase